MKTWRDISLRQAQELFTLDPKDFTEDFAYEIEMLSILTDTDPTEIENQLSAQELLDALKEYEFTKTLPKEKHTKVIEVNGKRYGQCELDKLSLGQMVDIEEYVNLGITENIHNIMGILYLPIVEENGEDYKLEKYEANQDRAQEFLDCNMEIVYGNLLFFYLIVTEFTNSLKDSLLDKTTEEMMMMTKEIDQTV